MQYNADINNNKNNFPSGQIFIPHSKTFKMFNGAKLDCMSHYAIPAVKSNLDRTVI